LELVADENQTSPCIYLAQVGDGGFKIGDASNGVRARYLAESGVTAIPILLTPRSLSGSRSGGKPDLDGTRSFAREAIETLAAVAIGGGLGKAAAIYGSAATLGAKPGLTSASYKPGMVGATPAQLAAAKAAAFKPGMAGATPAQLKAVEKRQAAANEKQALKRARDIEAGLGEVVEAKKRKALRQREREAGANLTCTHCDITYHSLLALQKHQRQRHPLCLPACLCFRRDNGSKMVGCDVCDGWFHIACLAQAPGFELDEDTEFVCPPCVAAGANLG